jgi:hypothetical protein
MYTLDTVDNDLNNLLPEWREPFPEPQTIPCRWDLSELHSASESASIADTTRRAEE